MDQKCFNWKNKQTKQIKLNKQKQKQICVVFLHVRGLQLMLCCWHKNIFLFIKEMTQDLIGEIYCYTHAHDSLFAKYLKSASKLPQKWLFFLGIWARPCFSLCNSYIPTF